MSINPIVYVAGNFPGLTFSGALFYRWPIGIRFDLGGRALTMEAIDEVRTRATALYEAVFDSRSSCLVVARDGLVDGDWLCRFPHVSPLFDFAQDQMIGLAEPKGQAQVQDLDDPDSGPYMLAWVEQKARAFDYESVIEGIGNADYGRFPAISSRVFFINTISGVIMHMYDDRGLDVIARDKGALLSLYRDFNSWILDYDRAQIDRTFSIR